MNISRNCYDQEKNLLLVAVLLQAAVCISGCTMNVSTPAQIPVPTMAQTIPLTTTAEPAAAPVTTTFITTTIVATVATTAPAGKEVLHETDVLTTKTCKTCDFKTLMGFKFINPKDRFRITIKSEKPILGYAVNTEQACRLQGYQLVPRYQSYMKDGIDWD